MEEIRQSKQTEMFYEAPHRIRGALEDLVAVLGPGRRVVTARELTKIHEEFLRGSAPEVLAILNNRSEVKGEIVLLIGPVPEEETRPATASVRNRVQQLMREDKLDEKTALKKVAKERGIGKSEAYREWQRGKST